MSTTVEEVTIRVQVIRNERCVGVLANNTVYILSKRSGSAYRMEMPDGTLMSFVCFCKSCRDRGMDPNDVQEIAQTAKVLGAEIAVLRDSDEPGCTAGLRRGWASPGRVLKDFKIVGPENEA